MGITYLCAVLLTVQAVLPDYIFSDEQTNLIWLSSDSSVQKRVIVNESLQNYFFIEVSENNEGNQWHSIYYDIPMESEQFIATIAYVKLLWKKDSTGVGLTLSFINKNNERIDYTEERLTEPTSSLVPIKIYTKTPPNTVKVRVSLFIHNQGAMECIEPTVFCPIVKYPEDNEPINLDISKKPFKNRLIGFGAEDDARFYDDNNRQGGVDEKAIELRKKRLTELRPDWVRTFVWFKDWNPTDDGVTFTFDTDGMQSLYKTLQEYKDLNTEVNITCVTWGMIEAWKDMDNRVNSIIALLNYLIKTRKFDNIKYFTLTNEPNYFFDIKEDRFKQFAEYHKILKEKFKKDGLNIKIIGSDDAMGTDWLVSCLTDKDCHNIADLWASHFYWHYTTSYFAQELFKERIKLLKEYGSGRKPFTVTEFGITDTRFAPPTINPIMSEYKGALYTCSAFIDGLNQGVSGNCIWCLQEVRYVGCVEPMRLGLWGYADKNWRLFPIYDVIKMFTNNTNRGDKIYPIESSNPVFFKCVKIGDKILWANLCEKQLKIILPNKNKHKTMYCYTKKIVDGYDSVERNQLQLLDGIAKIPPESFGVIE